MHFHKYYNTLVYFLTKWGKISFHFLTNFQLAHSKKAKREHAAYNNLKNFYWSDLKMHIGCIPDNDFF